MKTTLFILMCYFHQPVAIFLSTDTQSIITPFISAPVSEGAKQAAIALCKADEPEVPKNFEIWHLDKINKYTLTKRD
jgi:hypothetical protein